MDGIEIEIIDRVSRWFCSVDRDGNGSLDKNEIEPLFFDLGICQHKSDVDSIFGRVDSDNSGTIDLNEFQQMFMTELEKIKMAKHVATEEPLKMKKGKSAIPQRARQPFHKQFLLLLQRSVLQKTRGYVEMITNLTMIMASGLLVGVLLSSKHEVMLARERASGVSITAIFCAKAMLDVLENLLLERHGAHRECLSGRGQPDHYHSALSLCTGIFMNGTIGYQYFNVKTSGLVPVWSLSYSRWAVESIIQGEIDATAKHHYHYLLAQEMMMFYGYFPIDQDQDAWEEENPDVGEQSNQFHIYWRDVPSRSAWALFSLGICFRVLCLLLLHFGNSMQQTYDSAYAFMRTKIKQVVLAVIDIVSRDIRKLKQQQAALLQNTALLRTVYRIFSSLEEIYSDDDDDGPEDDDLL
ncbi:hypothetical protein CYMTET_33973 [Cymbomonas tetramitiformis]|uniref:EF-hand domain-containing protein n=1 Tax=Cymbomonas tetramitiformis TaxID=36881 RepID=A0AAE0FC83_9CHLO|nr:hypothetical protein CYMTET_33973 [Cymbomonas tetramitiformis]